jgi:outer membrane protein, heavy metal efflux system
MRMGTTYKESPAASIATLCLLLCMGGCATAPSSTGPALEELSRRTGVTMKESEPGASVVPASVDLVNGLSEDEAAVLSLSNSPVFQSQLALLGVAVGEKQRARTLSNPSLSSVLAAQWEATLAYSFDILWKRPARIRVADKIYAAQVQQVVQAGVDLVRDARLAHTQLQLRQTQAQLSDSSAARASRIARIARSRAESGDVSELEATSAEAQAAGMAQQATAAHVEVVAAQLHLQSLTRLSNEQWPSRLENTASDAPGTNAESLVELAWRQRADVRAAEIDVEAAGARIGLARAESFNLALGIKVADDGSSSSTRPTVDASLPLFDRGQAETTIEQARYRAAAQHLVATRDMAAQEVKEAQARLQTAGSSWQIWNREIVPRLEEAGRKSERAYAAGDISYLVVLESLRQLIEAQSAEAEAFSQLRQQRAQLERHVGAGLPLKSAGVIE